MEKTIRKNSKPYHILKTVLITGGILALGTLSPISGAPLVMKLLSSYVADKKFKKERFLQDLKRLQSRKLIDFRELPNGETKITLTALGKEKILVFDLDKMHLEKKGWDGKWRLLSFDIADDQKKSREALRKKIQDLGFYALQKSVFITPYNCEDEIDFICSVFEIDRNNVLLLEVDKFEGSEKLRNYFKL